MTRAPGQLPPPPKDWAGRGLVALFGGPMDPLTGRWYFTDDWQQQTRAAERMAAAGQARNAALDYQPTGRSVPHPLFAVTGDEWTHRSAA